MLVEKRAHKAKVLHITLHKATSLAPIYSGIEENFPAISITKIYRNYISFDDRNQ